MDELIYKLTEIRKAADQQLDKELEKLIDCMENHLHAEDARSLVDAALQLRSLDEGISLVDFKRILCTLDGFSRYSLLIDIADAENFTTVSSSLSELVHTAFYDILDDGILNLIRVECIEHFISDTLPTEETKFVRYYLTSNEWFGRKEEIEKRILDTNAGMPSLCEVKVVGMKRMWFGEIEKFSEFLKILGNSENYDALYDENMVSAIDKLMQPEKFKEWEN